MNEKIGKYTEDEILEHLTEGEGRGFLGRSMYDAIFDKIHTLKTENEQLQQENQKYKEALSKLNEMNADNYNKYCEELKKNIELKKQLNELKEIEKDHQRLNGELREELKKCI